jgi:hypothetical protein
LRAAVSLAFVALLVCLAHALWLQHMDRPRLEPALLLVAQHRLSGPSLTPHDDLRHPSWGRAEQARAGQPLLVDPRPAKRFVQPVPLQVQP